MSLSKTMLENALFEREMCFAKLEEMQARMDDLDKCIPVYRDRVLREEMGVTLRDSRDGVVR